MRCFKSLLVSLLIIGLLGFVVSNVNAVIIPTAPGTLTAPTPLMVAPTPSFAPGIGGGFGLSPLMIAPTPSFAPGIGGGIGFWPTALMFGFAPSVPAAGGAFPAAMLTPTSTFAPGFAGAGLGGGIFGGGIFGGSAFGGFGLWPTAAMLATAPPVPATGAAFPAAMFATPSAVAPGGGFALTPFMLAPTPSIGGGGTAFWPTGLMLPTSPTFLGGGLWPAAMAPII